MLKSQGRAIKQNALLLHFFSYNFRYLERRNFSLGCCSFLLLLQRFPYLPRDVRFSCLIFIVEYDIHDVQSYNFFI